MPVVGGVPARVPQCARVRGRSTQGDLAALTPQHLKLAQFDFCSWRARTWSDGRRQRQANWRAQCTCWLRWLAWAVKAVCSQGLAAAVVMAVPGGVSRGVGGHTTRQFTVRGAQVFYEHTSTHIRAVYGLAGLDGNCLGCRRLWRCRIPASCALTPCFGPSLPSSHRDTHTHAGVSHSVTRGTQLIVFVVP